MFEATTSIILALATCDLISAQRVIYCSDRSLKISNRNKYDVKITYGELLEGTPENLKLYVTIHWNVTGLEDTEYDGVLVRMKVAAEDIQIEPYEDCEASTTHLWFQTHNVSECGDVNNTMFGKCYNPPNGNNTISSCPCDKETCPLLEGVECTGSKKLADERTTGKYYSIPNNRRSIKYRIDFNTHYHFVLHVYYRQYATTKQYSETIRANFLCAEKLSASHGMSIVDANVKCCESNITALSPMDARKDRVILDENTRTLNVTLSWMPPAKIDTLQGVFPNLIMNVRTPIPQYRPALTETTEEGQIDGTERCSRDGRRTVVTAYRILPNVDYVLYMGAWHTGENSVLCAGGKCGYQLHFKLDIDPCDDEWNTCNPGQKCITHVVDGEVTVPKTSCEPIKGYVATTTQRGEPDSSETRKGVKANPTAVFEEPPKTAKSIQSAEICEKRSGYCHNHADCHFDRGNSIATCSCRDGMVGNGISKAYNGTECSGCPVLHLCDRNAICVKIDPPSVGFSCRCRDEYYGDGLKNGSRCSSKARRIVSIVVPLIILGIAIFIIILWCICSSGKRKGRQSNNIPL